MAATREKFKTYKDVFDRFTERNLFRLSSQNHFDELESPISIGKEANIFTAKKGSGKVIIKIYRLETCDFNTMFRYIQGDPRFMSLKKYSGQKHSREVIFAWSQREYRNLLKARELGVNVPTPLASLFNINVMEMIGDKWPCQKLKDAVPKNPGVFFKDVIKNMLLLHKAGYVHGDLSEYNILNYDEKPFFIDLSHTTTTKSPMFHELLERDIKNIIRFFSKLGVRINNEDIRKKFSLV